MDEAQARRDRFDGLPIRQAVLRQIVPAIFSQMVVLIYNLADTYFVGLLNAPDQTAAVTVSMPAFLMLTAISNLFAIGGASQVARQLGKRAPEAASAVSAIAFWFGLGSAVLFSGFFWCAASPILQLCGATAATCAPALAYAKWVIAAGGVGTVLNILLANLVRAEGRSLVAAFGVCLGGCVNVVLDPLLILPRFAGLGAAGAGLATAASNTLAALFFLVWLIFGKRRTVLRLSPRYLRQARRYLADIVRIGIPASVQYALTVVSVAALSKFVSGYGTAAVAALGIVKKLDQLPLYFSIGASNGLLPLLAYHHAAGNTARRRAAFRFGTALAVGFSLLCLVAYECFAPQLAGLFIQDSETIAYGAKFLRLMVVAMPLMSVCYPLIVQFQAMGCARQSLIWLRAAQGRAGYPAAVFAGSAAAALRLYAGPADRGCGLAGGRVVFLSKAAAGCCANRRNSAEQRGRVSADYTGASGVSGFVTPVRRDGSSPPPKAAPPRAEARRMTCSP